MILVIFTSDSYRLLTDHLFHIEFVCPGIIHILFSFSFQNCSLGIVGKDTSFTIYDDADIEKYVSFWKNFCIFRTPPMELEGHRNDLVHLFIHLSICQEDSIHYFIVQVWLTFDHSLLNSNCFIASQLLQRFLLIYRQTAHCIDFKLGGSIHYATHQAWWTLGLTLLNL